MKLVPLTVEHARAMVPQPGQPDALADLRDEANVERLIVAGVALALVDGPRVLAVGGIVDAGSGRGVGWCALAGDVGRSMTGVTRAAVRYLKATRFRRVEIVTRDGWREAERWALMLGFDLEGVSPAYFDDGTAGLRWGRVS